MVASMKVLIASSTTSSMLAIAIHKPSTMCSLALARSKSNFVLLFLGALVSNIGNIFCSFAISYWILDITNNNNNEIIDIIEYEIFFFKKIIYITKNFPTTNT